MSRLLFYGPWGLFLFRLGGLGLPRLGSGLFGLCFGHGFGDRCSRNGGFGFGFNLGFRFRLGLGCWLGAAGQNLSNGHAGQVLAVAIAAAGILAPALLEDDDVGPAGLLFGFPPDRGAGQEGW